MPLDACGDIESNLTDSIALIIKNASSIGCSAARQVFNVRFAIRVFCRSKKLERLELL